MQCLSQLDAADFRSTGAENIKYYDYSISGASRSSTGSEIPSESALSTMKNKELQQLCRDQGLTVSGNKRELIGRLLNGESDTNMKKNTIKSPAAALLSAWFLALISSTDMKVGPKNEENICSRVPRFLEAHSNFRILHTKSYGLLCWDVERLPQLRTFIDL